jgi:antitoxin component YwqK of YwqJK toxin-antitoxin module
MKYLFVFLLLGLTSIVHSQTAEQPYCKDILGFHGSSNYNFPSVPIDYSGEVFYCQEDCKVEYWLNYKDGKKDGLSRMWYKNGQLWYERNYKDGKEDGLRRGWYDSGKLRLKMNFKDGKGVGTYREWWESNGKLKIEYKYSESGDGTLDGWYYEYYEDADVKIMGKYKGGHMPHTSKKLGIWRYYYDTDFNKEQKSKKEVYTETGDGVLISEQCWDEDGNKIECPEE